MNRTPYAIVMDRACVIVAIVEAQRRGEPGGLAGITGTDVDWIIAHIERTELRAQWAAERRQEMDDEQERADDERDARDLDRELQSEP